jgi:hypothetical protein
VLLDQVQPLPTDPALQAHIAHVRGHIELACGTPGTACTLLVQGARQILGSNADLATEMLVLATWAALAANQLDRIVEEIGPANSRLTGQDDVRVKPVADSLFAFGLGGPAPADATQ